MQIRRVAHVISHDVDKIDVRQNAMKIDVTAVVHSGERKQFVGTDGLAYVAHEFSEITGIVGRC